ncbi:dihydrodipicolinate synthase family protein [Rhodothalassium salexigens]|uniref:dihydrodipicolinate synthase family protein n=1 Tax=Rhodothalassium salexigens TaxID=1086 RepID=UPI001913801A|nr:dihydrodipicolinate synthase family protein [Rhodothalassium salexigens]MBK5911737.1 dihydrodipicolinate synthase family protein [Rhodothalassium salexigens]MBK5920475.1 dihydrodipicolinate synthase family protein [Rhodothalassium salexigens]
MDRTSVDWKGYFPALTTPFHPDGSLDLEGWTRLLRWMGDQRMHGVVVAGTTGEWFSLSDRELAALFRRAGEILAGRMTLIAGVNSFHAQTSLAKARLAAESGFDGLLLTPPPYVKPSAREIAVFYADVAAAAPLPICLYNWPPGTHVDMTPDLLADLAELDTVVALKNSTPHWDRFLISVERLHTRLRLFGIPTNDEGIALFQAGKADGLMGAGAVLGSDHPDFFDAIWDGDIERARRLGQRDRKLMTDWFTPGFTGRFGSAQAILKTALDLRGLPGGPVRRPLLDLDRAGRDAVRRTLVDLGLPVASADATP